MGISLHSLISRNSRFSGLNHYFHACRTSFRDYLMIILQIRDITRTVNGKIVNRLMLRFSVWVWVNVDLCEKNRIFTPTSSSGRDERVNFFLT